LLPSRARGCETRLPKAARGKQKLTDHRTVDRNCPRRIEKSIDLVLIERLLDHGEIQRSIVDAPPHRELGVVIAERQHIARKPRLKHGALRKTVPVRAQACLQNQALYRRPIVLYIAAGLCVRSLRSRRSSERGLANKRAVRAQCLDLSAPGHLTKFQPRDVCAETHLMGSVPRARRRNDIEQALYAAAVLVDPREKISARSIHQQNVRVRALRKKILPLTVCRDAKFYQCVIQPDLIFERNEYALLPPI